MDAQGSLIRGTDFLFLPITDFARTEAFSVGVLGLDCSKRYANDLGGELETGGITIQVVDTARIGRPFAPSKGALALRVDDVPRARAELEARGVVFEGDILDSGVCHQAFFPDPDGNMLILHHRYAPPGVMPGDAG